MHESGPAGGAGRVQRELRRLRGDAAALERRQDAPAHLVHRLAVMLALPESDPTDSLALEDDLEAVGELLVSRLPLRDLLRRLRPAEVLHHRRIAQQPHEQGVIAASPRNDLDQLRLEPGRETEQREESLRVEEEREFDD